MKTYTTYILFNENNTYLIGIEDTKNIVPVKSNQKKILLRTYNKIEDAQEHVDALVIAYKEDPLNLN